MVIPLLASHCLLVRHESGKTFFLISLIPADPNPRWPADMVNMKVDHGLHDLISVHIGGGHRFGSNASPELFQYINICNGL